MNQDQVKALLLKLDPGAEPFRVIFSGKSSRRVHGLYKPEKQEILIHNKNFSEPGPLVYTAIHEFAHHIQFTRYRQETTNRVHSTRFWDIFHNLLHKAEKKGLYQNQFDTDPFFVQLTRRIQRDFLEKNGALMKELGKILQEAAEACKEKNLIFEDFLDRTLLLDRSSARSFMQTHAMDINPALGWDNMKIVSRLKTPRERQQAEEGFLNGRSPQQIRQEGKNPPPGGSLLEELEHRKQLLKASLKTINSKITALEQQIQTIKEKEEQE